MTHHKLIEQDEQDNPLYSKDRTVGLITLASTLFHIGSTTFGGMWAATQKLEKILVQQKKWFTTEELQSLLVAATLIPAPKFVGFGGLIGYKMYGWLGAIVSIFSLILPPSLLVLTGVLFISPSLLDGPLSALNRLVGIAVVGLLFGNAYRQLKSPKVKRDQKVYGALLGLIVFFLVILGVPLLVAAILGFTVGVILIRKDKEKEQDNE